MPSLHDSHRSHNECLTHPSECDMALALARRSTCRSSGDNRISWRRGHAVRQAYRPTLCPPVPKPPRAALRVQLDDLALDHEDNAFGDIGRPVGDPLQVMHDNEQISRLGYGLRVALHEFDQLELDTLAQEIDPGFRFGELPRRFDILTHKGIEHRAKHGNRLFSHARDIHERLDQPLLRSADGDLRDALRIIADSLQLARN